MHTLVGTDALKDTLPPEMSFPTRRASRQRLFDFSSSTMTKADSAKEESKPINGSSLVCSSCRKPFITGFRSRHYCYVCATSFCRRCGVVKHSHMVTCPVGSKCCCAKCLHDQAKSLSPRFNPSTSFPNPAQSDHHQLISMRDS